MWVASALPRPRRPPPLSVRRWTVRQPFRDSSRASQIFPRPRPNPACSSAPTTHVVADDGRVTRADRKGLSRDSTGGGVERDSDVSGGGGWSCRTRVPWSEMGPIVGLRFPSRRIEKVIDRFVDSARRKARIGFCVFGFPAWKRRTAVAVFRSAPCPLSGSPRNPAAP